MEKADLDMQTAFDEKARGILMQNNLYEIPADPVRLAQKYKIEVKHALFNDKNIAGTITKNNDNTVIYVNSLDSYNKQRFTIAHELGHYFLHLNEETTSVVDMYRNINSENDPKEIDANNFASSLLMDELLVRTKWNDLKSVQMISDIFYVSFEAMSFRLRNLSLV
jgi:Zn-dependent peptidase ImmA (M78 family)